MKHDSAYAATLREDNPMMHPVEIVVSIRGRSRTLTLPMVTPHDVTPALARIDWIRKIGDADQRVLEQAEAALSALARAGR